MYKHSLGVRRETKLTKSVRLILDLGTGRRGSSAAAGARAEQPSPAVAVHRVTALSSADRHRERRRRRRRRTTTRTRTTTVKGEEEASGRGEGRRKRSVARFSTWARRNRTNAAEWRNRGRNLGRRRVHVRGPLLPPSLALSVARQVELTLKTLDYTTPEGAW